MMIKHYIKRIPLVRDGHAYYRDFGRKVASCRGGYPSYQAAWAALPKSGSSGYGQPVIASHPKPSELTACIGIGDFDQRDYPVLVWLAKAFETESNVFDLGGNLGHAY